MYKIIKEKFIKKYWFNIVETDDSFNVVNTHRKLNRTDRDDIERTVDSFETVQEAEKRLEEYEKGIYGI